MSALSVKGFLMYHVAKKSCQLAVTTALYGTAVINTGDGYY